MRISYYIFILVILTVLSIHSCFAVSQTNKDLYIKPGYAYLLAFDEEIIRYKIGNESSINAETPANIYADRHEIIIKAKKTLNTNLIIWTKLNVYNFNINIGNYSGSKTTTQASPLLQEFIKSNPKLKQEVSPLINDFEFDKPPFPPQHNTYSIEIDKPPTIRK